MNWSWSEVEDAALDYLPHQAQVLYLRVLRRHMDFDTGIVGLSRRLSEVMFAEWLEVHPAQGSTAKKIRPTRGEVRAMVRQLERKGLLERVPKDKRGVLPLVFRLPLARTGLIRPKCERQINDPKKTVGTTAMSSTDKKLIGRLFSPAKSRDSGDSDAVDKCKIITPKMPMNDSAKNQKNDGERPTSVKSSLSLNNNIITRARGNGYTIPDDWLPSVAIVEKIVFQFQLPQVFIQQKAIELRILWREQNMIALNWDAYFYGTCENKIIERDGEFLSAQEFFARRGG